MASFARTAPPPRAAWTVEEAALFAARKEFELLRLLSTDKKALATARRLGAFRPHPQAHPSAAAADAGARADSSPTVAAAPAASQATPTARRRAAARSARRQARQKAQPQVQPLPPAVAAGEAVASVPPTTADAASVGQKAAPNARQRRSAARSARRHAAMRAGALKRIRSLAQVCLFVVRLRRIRGGTLGLLEDLSDSEAMPGSALKRGRGRDSGSSSSSSNGDEPCFACHCPLPADHPQYLRGSRPCKLCDGCLRITEAGLRYSGMAGPPVPSAASAGVTRTRTQPPAKRGGAGTCGDGWRAGFLLS